MMHKAEADEKVMGGWLRAWIAFEVLAVESGAASSAIEELIGNLEKEDKVGVYSKELSEVRKVENPPLRGIKEAFSRIAKIELVAKSINVMLELVIKYGPSAVEILEPKKLVLQASEAQVMLIWVSVMMHVFASAGIGGLVFTRKQQGS